MSRVHPDIAYRNDINLPLFAWARQQAERRAELAPAPPCWRVRAIARQTGLTLGRAKLVAGFLGIEPEDVS